MKQNKLVTWINTNQLQPTEVTFWIRWRKPVVSWEVGSSEWWRQMFIIFLTVAMVGKKLLVDDQIL